MLVDGKDVTDVPANRRDMGMVFQAYSLFPHLTAQDNVEFGLRLRKVDRAKRAARAREMLDLVGLADRAERYATELSGGQQQRVALARALAIEPSVLLLDEPLSALDAKVRTQLRDEIRRVQLEVGTTTLFVTHDQEEALAMADRVGVMSQGRLQQLDTPQELYAHPRNAFVADFVGLMNRVPTDGGGRPGRRARASASALVDGSVTAGPGTALVRPEQLLVRPDAGGRRRGPRRAVLRRDLAGPGAGGRRLRAGRPDHRLGAGRPGRRRPLLAGARRRPAARHGLTTARSATGRECQDS